MNAPSQSILQVKAMNVIIKQARRAILERVKDLRVQKNQRSTAKYTVFEHKITFEGLNKGTPES